LDVPEVAVEFRTMVAGLNEQVRPVGTVSVRVTVPLKPLIAVTVIVEFASRFVSTAALVGVALTLKSTPATVTVVEDDSEPEVPVTVITALPVWEPAVMVMVAFCFPPATRMTEFGVKVATKPQAQPLTLELRFTVPLKLPRLVKVIVELTDPPAGIVRACGLADTLKPCTSTLTVVDLVVVPFDPTTVTM
jgi:hypothetical protein